ncbi:hypothetical protein C0989_000832 [Termitomyces sp. Mn162]|nr:hypothetical protein C0989_000832 [Termitomyces sp. Mn162]
MAGHHTSIKTGMISLQGGVLPYLGTSLENPDVILWRGPAEEVWEEGTFAREIFQGLTYECPVVQVGILSPRIPLLPVSLPYSLEILWE